MDRPVERSITIALPDGGGVVHGDLVLPAGASGVVVFAHGSGSSRHSPRNRQVAESLRGRGLGTLLMDLLTPAEDAVDARTGQFRFDVGMLGGRLSAAVAVVAEDSTTRGLPVGLFGASTGGGAALVSAGRHPDSVAAVVSRGGRPDLAGDLLPHVTAPTLLIVGEHDPKVLELNRAAYERLAAERALEIVPGATHLFEEPGALDHVARLAGDWFVRHLAGA